MYGWRSRIGIIIPSDNTVMECEFNKALHGIEGISVHASRIYLDSCDEESLIRMETQVERAALELWTARVNVIVYGCTSGSFICGLGWDKDIINKITNKTKIPSTTTSTAALEAFQKLNIRKISFISPYSGGINDKAKKFFEDNGIGIASMYGMNLPDLEVGLEFPYTSYNIAKKINNNDSDAVFISCTDLRTFEIIKFLEKEINKPVLTSNQVSLWHALRLSGLNDEITDLGRLLLEVK